MKAGSTPPHAGTGRNFGPVHLWTAVGVAVFLGIGLSGDLLAATQRILGPVLLAAITILASTGTGLLGGALLQKISGEQDRIDRASSFILGYPLFGTVLFLLAAVAANRWTVMIPAASLALIGAVGVWRSGPELPPISWTAGLLFVPIVGTLTVQALLPAVSLDEVAYHLAIPRIWLGLGVAAELPWMSHSYFPLATEAADLPALAALGHQGAMASHLVHAAVAVAMFLLMMRYVGVRLAGIAGVAAIAATPALLLVAGWSNTDVPLIAVAVVLLARLDRLRSEGGGVAAVSLAIASGLLIKYTFVLVVLVLVGVTLLTTRERGRAARATLFGVLIGSVFFLRNLALTGNPIEPFLTGEGRSVARFRWTGEWLETARSYLFDPRLIDDSLGFVLPALALGGLALAPRLDSWRRAVVLGSMTVAFSLTLVGPAARILLPFLVVSALIALAGIAPHLRRTGAIVLATVVTAAGFLQLGVSWLHLERLEPFEVINGDAGDWQWVSGHRATSGAVEAGDELLRAAGARTTLVIGIGELYWFHNPVVGGANFDSGAISRELEGDPSRIAVGWRESGVTHLLVYPRRIAVGDPPATMTGRQRDLTLSKEAARNLGAILRRHATPVASNPEAQLHSLSPISGSSSPASSD